jgi:hypothetical protein
MKVIAQITQDLIMCEVSSVEIAKLHGASSRYDKAWDESWIRVGTEHDMAGAFNAVDAIRSFDRSQLKYLKDRIDSMTKEYDSILQAYEKLTLFDKLSMDSTNVKD